jgi:hypothetical protein
MKAVQPGDEDVAKFLPATERIPDCLDLSELPTSARCALRKTAGGRELRKTRSMAPLLLLYCPQRPKWPPPDERILAGGEPVQEPNSGQNPSRVGCIELDFPKIWHFLERGGKFASNPRDRGYKGVRFEFVPGVGRCLNGGPLAMSKGDGTSRCHRRR